jgi:hypothetical protein
MRTTHWIEILVLSLGISCIPVLAQVPQEAQQAPQEPQMEPQNPSPPPVAANSVPAPEPGPAELDWTPPALAQLSAQADARSSFVLDRTMLIAASSLLPGADQQTRQAIGKLDGISVHLLRFNARGVADEAQVEALREAYHRPGWKHLVTATGTGGPIRNGSTDLWLTMDGVNVRAAVLLVETPKSLALVTLKGDLSPVDVLHLRGHFGIPRFDGEGFKGAQNR